MVKLAQQVPEPARTALLNRTERRDLEVYFVELGRRNHEAYALAFDRTKRQKVLVFKLDRMLYVQLLNDTYVVPSDFDPEASLNDAFGVVVGDGVKVSVRVTPAAALQFKELAQGSLGPTAAVRQPPITIFLLPLCSDGNSEACQPIVAHCAVNRGPIHRTRFRVSRIRIRRQKPQAPSLGAPE